MAAMARAAVAIELLLEDEVELQRVVRASSSSQQEALRARIVLRAAEGATNREIAQVLNTSEVNVRVTIFRALRKLRERMHSMGAAQA